MSYSLSSGRTHLRLLPLIAHLLGLGLPGQYVIYDRDAKFCPAFRQLMDEAGVKRVPLPARSPNLNAYAERWVRSVNEEALSQLILFGERSLRYALTG
jgi:putative transposase